MKIFILILWIHVGPMSDKDSMAITSIPSFSSLQECNAAGNRTTEITKGTVKSAKFICVEGVK